MNKEIDYKAPEMKVYGVKLKGIVTCSAEGTASIGELASDDDTWD